MSNKLISALFYVSAVYYGVLGLAFLLAPNYVFDYFRVPPPNHFAYVQFPAMLLLIFALMFSMVGKQPERHIDLILYGILLKLSYCSITAFYWVQGSLPEMWQPFTICDAIMGFLYIWAFVHCRIRKHPLQHRFNTSMMGKGHEQFDFAARFYQSDRTEPGVQMINCSML